MIQVLIPDKNIELMQLLEQEINKAQHMMNIMQNNKPHNKAQSQLIIICKDNIKRLELAYTRTMITKNIKDN